MSPVITAPRAVTSELVRPRVRVEAIAREMTGDAKRWLALAIGSLVIAGLLSLSVVIGRLPPFASWIGDPLFFKRCLVVHVDLALLVWFYAFIAGLIAWSTRVQGCGNVAHRSPRDANHAPLGERRATGIPRFAFASAVLGVGAMLAGALAPGAQPILANYVPVIDHPLFLTGLVLFFGGISLSFVQSLAAFPVPGGPGALASGFAVSSRIGLQTSALAVVLAGVTWIAARAGLPAGLDASTRYEFTMWGPGHVLQVANAAAMLAVWLWLLERATGRALLSPRAARMVFGVLLAPHLAMPLLTARGTLHPLYHTGATQLMRWGIFPVVLVVLVLGVRHLWRASRTDCRAGPCVRAALDDANGPHTRSGPTRVDASVARVAFYASAGLTLLGFMLGACIRSSTTLVPAHYHASLGAVTVAFMAAAYLVAAEFARDRGTPARFTWRGARLQVATFGIGQTIFALGFAIGGAHGLGRKAYASEQHVRSLGEWLGLGVMGLGGLVATIAGVWFLVLMLREIPRWRAAATPLRGQVEDSSLPGVSPATTFTLPSSP